MARESLGEIFVSTLAAVKTAVHASLSVGNLKLKPIHRIVNPYAHVCMCTDVYVCCVFCTYR